MTPLCIACYTGNVDAVKLLIDSGCDVNLRSKSGNTPIEVACVKNNYNAAKILLDSGCKLDTLNGDGFTPLMMACAHTNPGFVKMMINKIGRVENMISVLLVAYTHNREVYNYLCQKYFPDSDLTPLPESKTVLFKKKQ